MEEFHCFVVVSGVFAPALLLLISMARAVLKTMQT